MMLKKYFGKPRGTGTSLNLYMFRPHRIIHALKVLATNPAYFKARLSTISYQLKHPDHPWLTAAAIAYITETLDSTKRAFEWGSGRSTIWLAKRVRHLVSVEDDKEWYHKIRPRLTGYSVDYFLIGPENAQEQYPGRILDYPDGHFDLILVDGSHRAACIRNAVSKIVIGGSIIVDNADQGVNTTPLKNFQKIPTDNGVWSTDIFVREA